MKEMICIVCPKGCRLSVSDAMEVTGNGCPRGKDYAITELTAPTRVLTSTVQISGGLHPRLPVRTSKPIPKGAMFEVMDLIGQIRAAAPIALGTVLAENILNTGADLIACKTVHKE